MFGIDDLFFIIAGTVYTAAKGIGTGANSYAEKQYIKQKGYNQERKHQLEMLVDSYYATEREAFDKLLGRVIDRRDSYAKRAAIQEIAEKEGWKYFDVAELCRDPHYVKLIGGKIPDWRR